MSTPATTRASTQDARLPGTSAARYGGGNRLTAMNAAHDAFARDLDRLRAGAAAGAARDPRRHRDLVRGWILFKGMLDIHHHAEDDFIWPRLRLRLAGSEAALSILDEMEAEHELIDPLVGAIDASLAEPAPADRPADSADLIEEFTLMLAQHMRHEEREAMPMIGQALSEREWNAVVGDIHGFVTRQSALSVADFLPWLTDGRPGGIESAILTDVAPAVARPVYTWFWKPRYERTSRW